MSTIHITRYVKPIEDVRADLLARFPGHPWAAGTDRESAERAFSNIRSLDRDEWAEAFSAEARPYEDQAIAAEAARDHDGARAHYHQAYCHYRMARYPAPNSPAKR